MIFTIDSCPIGEKFMNDLLEHRKAYINIGGQRIEAEIKCFDTLFEGKDGFVIKHEVGTTICSTIEDAEIIILGALDHAIESLLTDLVLE